MTLLYRNPSHFCPSSVFSLLGTKVGVWVGKPTLYHDSNDYLWLIIFSRVCRREDDFLMFPICRINEAYLGWDRFLMWYKRLHEYLWSFLSQKHPCVFRRPDFLTRCWRFLFLTQSLIYSSCNQRFQHFIQTFPQTLETSLPVSEGESCRITHPYGGIRLYLYTGSQLIQHNPQHSYQSHFKNEFKVTFWLKYKKQNKN